jgi:hypothetical protein
MILASTTEARRALLSRAGALYDAFFDRDGEGDRRKRDAFNAWAGRSVPLFDCPDAEIVTTYYFRWWTYAKHIKQTPLGAIVTEFLPPVPWAGWENSIVAAAGHHIYEGRWLRGSRSFLPDYIRFWFSPQADSLRYRTWLADAVAAYASVTGDRETAAAILPQLAARHLRVKELAAHPSGLYWSDDDGDGMEHSLSGNGLRPTINAYLYGDAAAMARIASWTGNRTTAEAFSAEAGSLRGLVLSGLWRPRDSFFKTIPLDARGGVALDPRDGTRDARELVGYLPWYFGLPPDTDAHGAAWDELLSEEGFEAPFGPTTAERRHPRFMHPVDHECLWNGPSWPFATSQTLTALAVLLRGYARHRMTRAVFLSQMQRYARCQRLAVGGAAVPWIDENLDPFTGTWLARDILARKAEREGKPPMERGKDYNHSTFCDLVISGLAGVSVDGTDGSVAVDPLVPEDEWSHFALLGVELGGRLHDVIWDRDGTRYGLGAGLRVLREGEVVAAAPRLSRLELTA